MTGTSRCIGDGVFHLGDCFERMAEIPNGSVDMVVTSPPYDNLRSYNGGAVWTFEVFSRIARRLASKIKEGGVIVWVVADATVKGSETGSSFRQALFFMDECGLRLHDTMIWNKQGFSAVGSLASRYAPVFEYMFVFSKGAPAVFNPIKDRPNKWAGTKVHGTIRVDGDKIVPVSNSSIIQPFGQRFNVWEKPPVRQKGDGKHPAPFPVTLAQDHILSWTNAGDVVLDPFGGSGTTAVAAENTRRRWICIERYPDYFAKACERVAVAAHEDIA